MSANINNAAQNANTHSYHSPNPIERNTSTTRLVSLNELLNVLFLYLWKGDNFGFDDINVSQVMMK